MATDHKTNYAHHLKSLEDLLRRDRQREKDGFPRKIRVGGLIRTGKEKKVVVIPVTQEEKFTHDYRVERAGGNGDAATGGSGPGEPGEVIGEQPIHQPEGEGQGAGEGPQHGMGVDAYDLGRVLTEKFQLPHLVDEGKKRSLTQYTYDLTDKNRGSGQFLDKKGTLRRIIQTNIALGRIRDVTRIDPERLLVTPRDRVYHILSREQEYESQALVFFLRDYSSSMTGRPTQMVVSQHVLIYSWLTYQYQNRVTTRFILHDTQAREVPDFETYSRASVAGGTRVASAFGLVNEIIERESLARDYNLYVFHGTDGEDWADGRQQVIEELKKMLLNVNRVGITIAKARSGDTEVEKNLRESGLLEARPDRIRVDALRHDADEERIIEGIRRLISEEVFK